MKRTEFKSERHFVGRLPKGIDLLESLTRVINDEDIKVGTVEIHGYLGNAVFDRKNLETGFDESQEIPGPLKIGAMSGTISLFKRRALPHVDGVLVTNDGRVVAGTIGPGSTVYACEVVITELVGGSLSRDFDPDTGLPLWKRNALLVDDE